MKEIRTRQYWYKMAGTKQLSVCPRAIRRVALFVCLFLVTFSLSRAGLFTGLLYSLPPQELWKFANSGEVGNRSGFIGTMGTVCAAVAATLLISKNLTTSTFRVPTWAVPASSISLFLILHVLKIAPSIFSELSVPPELRIRILTIYSKDLLYILGVTYLFANVPPRDRVTCVAWLNVVVTVTSLVLCLTDGSYRVSNLAEGTGWRGLFESKNSLALYICFSIPVLVMAANQLPKGVAAFTLLLNTFLLINSQGKTAIFAGSVFAVLYATARMLRSQQHRISFVRAILAVTVMAFCLVAFAIPIFVLAEMHVAPGVFTSRGTIWNGYLDYMARHGMLGFGFESERNPEVMYFVRSGPVHTHNSFLQTTFEYGLPGLLCYCGLVIFIARKIASVRSEKLMLVMALTLLMLFFYAQTENLVGLYFGYPMFVLFLLESLTPFPRREGPIKVAYSRQPSLPALADQNRSARFSGVHCGLGDVA